MLKEDQDPEVEQLPLFLLINHGQINDNVAYVINEILEKGSAINDNIPLLEALLSGTFVPILITKIKTNVCTREPPPPTTFPISLTPLEPQFGQGLREDPLPDPEVPAQERSPEEGAR